MYRGSALEHRLRGPQPQEIKVYKGGGPEVPCYCCDEPMGKRPGVELTTGHTSTIFHRLCLVNMLAVK